MKSAPVIPDGVAQGQCVGANPDAVQLGMKQLYVI
jgi:hypothetical protein